VVRIDGMPVREALHKEMLNFIRSKTHVTLSVRGTYHSISYSMYVWSSVHNTQPLSSFQLHSHSSDDAVVVLTVHPRLLLLKLIIKFLFSLLFLNVRWKCAALLRVSDRFITHCQLLDHSNCGPSDFIVCNDLINSNLMI